MAGEFDAGFRFIGNLIIIGIIVIFIIGFVIGHWLF